MKKTFILSAIILCAGFGTAARAEVGARRPADKRDRVATPPASRVVRVGPRSTYLKEGLSTEDVLRMVGRPSDVFERFEDGKSVMVYVFERGENRVLVAEFVEGRLVRSRIESRAEGERAESVNF